MCHIEIEPFNDVVPSVQRRRATNKEPINQSINQLDGSILTPFTCINFHKGSISVWQRQKQPKSSMNQLTQVWLTCESKLKVSSVYIRTTRSDLYSPASIWLVHKILTDGIINCTLTQDALCECLLTLQTDRWTSLIGWLQPETPTTTTLSIIFSHFLFCQLILVQFRRK